MGTSISGGMVVGRMGCEIMEPGDYDGDFDGWTEEMGFDRMYPQYDADEEDCYYGFTVSAVDIEDIDEWVIIVKRLSKKFEEVTGVPARLIGSQNVT